MIISGISGIISVGALFLGGHYILAFTLTLLNLMLGIYLLYGKLLKFQWFEKVVFKKDIYAMATAGVITGIIYGLLCYMGDKEIEVRNADLMMVSVYVLLLGLVFVAIKIQKEEGR